MYFSVDYIFTIQSKIRGLRASGKKCTFATQVSTEWMKKMCYSDNEILFSLKRNPVTSYNMGEHIMLCKINQSQKNTVWLHIIKIILFTYYLYEDCKYTDKFIETIEEWLPGTQG